jgi:UDP-N-acetylmuramoyl-tripeptide--D-alanyl-D-alanine ligase
VAVLGEMLELGDRAIPLHQESGRRSAAAGVEWLVAIGGAPARAMADAAVAAGMPSTAVVRFDDSESAAGAVAAAVRPGDLVLVKGSRGTRVDVVTDRIVAEFS